MSELRNIFACLVHEKPDCVMDLVRNLRCLDPDSTVLLYNGGSDANLLRNASQWERGVVIHPHPQPMKWGRLHDFALDCMRFALAEMPFETMTIVDSDQLAMRAGYSQFLAAALDGQDGVGQIGMLGNAPGVQPRHSRISPVMSAFREFDLWRDFLRRFKDGESKFVHWTFWPSTVFTAAAAGDLVRIFDTDEQLQELMRRTRMFATEEVILPTLVALLGYRVIANPCRDDLVKFRVRYTTQQINAGLRKPDIFWVHPVNRQYDDHLRKQIRAAFGNYENTPNNGGSMTATETNHDAGLLLTWPILQRMKTVEGWLEEDEADLLIAATAIALREMPAPRKIVEIGSYCGRSTVVFGSVVKAVNSAAKVYAIDPHDGKVGALDQGLIAAPPTLEKFQRNIAMAGLTGIVETIRQFSFDVAWQDPIHLLFIDGLHDYANVARDFHQFEPWVVEGGYIAFHDYADYYPGVKTFVNEVLATGRFRRVHCARSLMLMRKVAAAPAGRNDSHHDGHRTDSLSQAGNAAAPGATPPAPSSARVVQSASGHPKTLADFKGLHEGGTIIVCGCGESLNDLAHPERYITIGVNDIGRRFHPDYLVVVNPRNQFKDDRFRYVETSQARYLFTQLDLGVPHPHVIKFRLGGYGETEMSDPDALHYTQNSPYVAICLAARMGARRIGLIGVDFTDHHFFGKTGTHALTKHLATIDEQYRRLGEALRARGIEVFNLSSASRLTAFPKMAVEAFTDLGMRDVEGELKKEEDFRHPPLKIVSYATTPVAGVPAILARCINARTPHSARCVWAQNGYGNGVAFTGDIEWQRAPREAEAALAEADVIIVHNGKVAPQHEHLMAGKAIITMAHNYLWNVDPRFVERGFPGMVIGQYQATLPEFDGWQVVPNPVPFWEPDFQPGGKPQTVTICYTPSGKHERYPAEHRLYWHAKGYETTMRALEHLAARYPLRLEVIRDRQVTHAEALAMKRRAHIVIDECVTGSYHRNSLEGLAAGCVVVNGLGLLPGVADVFQHCAIGSQTIPFAPSGLDDLEATLAGLVERGADTLIEEGARNRRWLEEHWDFAQQWERFWMPAMLQARAKAGPVTLQPANSRPAAKTTAQVSRLPNPVSAEKKVSVIIPHGGLERLSNLAATLANLKRCAGVGQVIVVEMGDEPTAEALARDEADKYVFTRQREAFQRARALNLGIPFADHELLLWMDNDLIVPDGFIHTAIEELRTQRLDFLVPYASVYYLSETDSDAVRRGGRRAVDCAPVNTYHARQGMTGGMGVVRKEFVLKYGGLSEDFRGWGGEDNAWFHKARLLGRAGVTGNRSQLLYHLFHSLSGGYGGNHIASNPYYAANLSLLKAMRAVNDPGTFLRKFPSPDKFSCPWEKGRQIGLISEDDEQQVQLTRQIARSFNELYGIEPVCHTVSGLQPDAARMPSLNAFVVFGTKPARRLLSDDHSPQLWPKTLVAHNGETRWGEKEAQPPPRARYHLAIDKVRAEEDSTRCALLLAQPLSLILGIGEELISGLTGEK